MKTIVHYESQSPHIGQNDMRYMDSRVVEINERPERDYMEVALAQPIHTMDFNTFNTNRMATESYFNRQVLEPCRVVNRVWVETNDIDSGYYADIVNYIWLPSGSRLLEQLSEVSMRTTRPDEYSPDVDEEQEENVSYINENLFEME